MASSFRRRAKPPGGHAVSQTPSTSQVGQAESSSIPVLPPSTPSQSVAGLPGTKPSWASSGIALTSTGLGDFDALLGGGQPLGTCVLLGLDDKAQSSLGSCLLKYWCAEGLSHDHHLLVPILGAKEDEENRDVASWRPSPWTTDDADERHPLLGNREAVLRLLRSLPRNRLYSAVRRYLPSDAERDEHGGPEETNALETLREKAAVAVGRIDEIDEDEYDEDDDDDHHHHDDDDWEQSSRRKEAEANLKNAWQYSEAEQRKRQGVSHHSQSSSRRSMARGSGRRDDFCQSYDLSGNWTDTQVPQGLPVDPEKAASLEPIRWDSSRSRREEGFAFDLQLCHRVQSLLVHRPKVVRLLLHVPDDDGDHIALGALAVALPMFLAHIRSEQLPVVVLVATPGSLWSRSASSPNSVASSLLLLHRTCDAVLEVENFASRRDYPPPAEFRHLHGLLKIRKAATNAGSTANGMSAGHYADWTASKRPAAFLYGLKRNRRSLSIPMLHIPPEDYAEGGGSVGSGGVRSGAGRPKEKSLGLGCSSGGGAGGTSLDF